jgi:hypothetical protein
MSKKPKSGAAIRGKAPKLFVDPENPSPIDNLAITNTLRARYKLFAEEYAANGRDGKKAALAAGYAESSAVKEAKRILNIPEVAEHVENLVNERLERVRADGDKALSEMNFLATANIADVVDLKTGAIKNDVDPGLMRAVQKIRVKTIEKDGFLTTEHEVTMNDKIRAADAVMRATGMYDKDKLKIEGNPFEINLMVKTPDDAE